MATESKKDSTNEGQEVERKKGERRKEKEREEKRNRNDQGKLNGLKLWGQY